MKQFDQFKSDWLGKQIDFDRVWRYQCCDLILQGLYEMDGIGSGVRGNAIDFWNRPSAPLEKVYERVPGIIPQAGDIAIFKTKGYYGDPGADPGDGHIGWATGQYNGTQMEIFEQNGQTGSGSGTGLDAIRYRWIDRNRLAGLWRKRPTSAPYRVEDIPTKEIVLNKDTYLWNMVYRSFDEIASHPVAGYPVRYKQTTAAICHHASGESYYMVGNNDTTGFNVKDCDDYVAPVPAPYVPPAGALPIPEVKRKSIDWGVPTYATAMDAKMKRNALADKLVPGVYIILESDDKVFHLTANNMKNGNWVNIEEDLPPIAVTPPVPPKIITTIQEAAAKISPTVDDSWKSSIASFHLDDRSPEFFWATNTSPMVIKDLEGKREDIVMSPYNSDAKGVPRRMPVIATLEKDGILYGWPEQAYKAHIYYCVPLFVLRADKGGIFDDVTDWMERVVTHTMRLSDHPKLAWYKFTKFVDGIKQTQPGKD